MGVDATIEGLLRRERAIVVAFLLGVIALCWVYVLAGAGMEVSAFELTRMSRVEPPIAGMAEGGVPWTGGRAVVMFFMWWIMMIAMMLPGATPMVLLFAAVNRRQRQRGGAYVSTTIFIAMYLLAWAGFSLAATGLHWQMDEAGLLAPGMSMPGSVHAGVLLIAAGLYQLTPIKNACVKHCRLPAAWLASHWRPGIRGALILGLQHGVYCLGCCWLLMLLLFYGGVMNLYWIAGLALYVLLEKVIPAGHWLDRGLGVMLVAWGGWLVVP